MVISILDIVLIKCDFIILKIHFYFYKYSLKKQITKEKKNLFLNIVLTVTNLDVNFCKHFITQNLEIKVL